MDDEPNATHCGKFGYEIFNGSIVIPYIFRFNEKYCATKVFSWHFEMQNINLSSHLIDFGYLKGYEMYREEACLMNEINKFHNDSMYPFTFNRNDTLVKLEDVGNIFKYVDECAQKLKSGTQYKMVGGSGVARLWLPKSEQYIVLPYVQKNGQRYVPIHILFASNTVSHTLNVTKLTGIDVMYMRFLLDVLKIKITTLKFEVPCVNLDGLVAHLTANEDGYYDYDENYWPSKENNNPKTNNNNQPFSTSTSNKNNSADQPKVPPGKRKLNSPNIETKRSKQKISMDENGKEELIKKQKTDKSKKDDVYYEVDHLVDYRKDRKGNEEVRVRWKGYSTADDTWEPVSCLNANLKDDVTELRKMWANKTKAKKK
ncbi:uncharacterized protein LOC129568463 [Sitodiplosis mosellana]|uniref:uncharacterized protein LOC129568463 n=1 Tax=Sitodiplosis mosellana TaxID=263140 RepID=UPI002443AFB1|nr:uncharacterized protein LOC129568463 [Sitodiplosis mosellana]